MCYFFSLTFSLSHLSIDIHVLKLQYLQHEHHRVWHGIAFNFQVLKTMDCARFGCLWAIFAEQCTSNTRMGYGFSWKLGYHLFKHLKRFRLFFYTEKWNSILHGKDRKKRNELHSGCRWISFVVRQWNSIHWTKKKAFVAATKSMWTYGVLWNSNKSQFFVFSLKVNPNTFK